MRIKTQLNSILAIITAIVVTMSSSLVSINILAADTTDYIVNGDFENGNLEGYIYMNTSHKTEHLGRTE